MTYRQASSFLKKIGQEHILKYYKELSRKERASLLSQIEQIDWSLLKLLDRKEMKVEKGELALPFFGIHSIYYLYIKISKGRNNSGSL